MREIKRGWKMMQHGHAWPQMPGLHPGLTMGGWISLLFEAENQRATTTPN